VKWTQNPDAIQGEGFDTLVVSLETDDVEVMQSSEILYRELKARGYKVLFDDRKLTSEEKRAEFPRFKNSVVIEIGREGLSRDGRVKLISVSSGASERILLEETLEKLEEFKNANGRL